MHAHTYVLTCTVHTTHTNQACVCQVKEIQEKQAAHSRELQLKDEIIQSKKKEANKWQVMSMAASGTDFEKFKQFSAILQSPDKGSSSAEP